MTVLVAIIRSCVYCQLMINSKTNRSTKGGKYLCPSGKVRYRDHEQGVRALHQEQNSAKREITDFGVTRRFEQRSYYCAQCRGHHLSSKPMRFTIEDWGIEE
jgi:hypothetical protein